MKKRITSGILALCMLISLFPVTALATYDDIAGHWGEEAIERWSDYGIVEGDGKNFNPDGLMSRGAAAAVFARLLGLSEKADISKYSDVNADAWYADAIAMCVEAGIMSGVAGNLMDPNGPLTREQFFVMYARALGIEEEETMNKSFDDAGEVSDWAQGSINALVNKGFIDGISDDTLAPDVDINRASVMSLLDKSIAAYVNEDNAEVTVEGDGIILVVADNVTIKGEGDITLVAATEGKVDLKEFEGDVEVNIVSDGAEIENVPEDTKLNVKEGIEDAKVNDKVVDKDTTEAPAPAPVPGGSIGGGSIGGGTTGGQPEGGNPEGGNPEGGNPETKPEVKPATGINNIEKHGSVQIHVDLPEDKTGISYFSFTFYDSTNPEASRMEGITCSKDAEDPTFYVVEEKFDPRFNYDRAEVTSIPLEGYEKAVYTETVSINIEQLNVGINPVFVMPTDGNPNRVEITFDNALTPGMLMHIAVWENASAETPIMNTNTGEYNNVSSYGLSVSRSVSDAETTAIQAGSAFISIDRYEFSAEKKNGIWTMEFTNIKSEKTAISPAQTPVIPELPTEIGNIRLEKVYDCLVLKWDAVKDADGYKIEFTTDNGITWGGSNNTSDTHVDLCFLNAGVYNGVKITAKQGNTELTTKEDKTVSFTIGQGDALEWDNINISLEKVENNKYDMEITGLAPYAHYEVKFTPETATGGYSAFSSDADADGKAASTIGSSNLDDYVANGYISIFIHASANVSADGKTGSVFVNKTAEKKYADLQSGAQNGNLRFVTNSNTGIPYLAWDAMESVDQYKIIFTPNQENNNMSKDPVAVYTQNTTVNLYILPVNGYKGIKVVGLDKDGIEIDSYEDKELVFGINTEQVTNKATAEFSETNEAGVYDVEISDLKPNTSFILELHDANGNLGFDCFRGADENGEAHFGIGNENVADCVKNGTYFIIGVEPAEVEGKTAIIKFVWYAENEKCTPTQPVTFGNLRCINDNGIPALDWDSPSEDYKFVTTLGTSSTNIVETHNTRDSQLDLNFVSPGTYKYIKVEAVNDDNTVAYSCIAEDITITVTDGGKIAAPTVEISPVADETDKFTLEIEDLTPNVSYNIQLFKGDKREFSFCGVADADGYVCVEIEEDGLTDVIENGTYTIIELQNVEVASTGKSASYKKAIRADKVACASAIAKNYPVSAIRFENRGSFGLYLVWDIPAGIPAGNYEYMINVYDESEDVWRNISSTSDNFQTCALFEAGTYNGIQIATFDNNANMEVGSYIDDSIKLTVTQGAQLSAAKVVFTPVDGSTDGSYEYDISGSSVGFDTLHYLKMYDENGKHSSTQTFRTDGSGKAHGVTNAKNFAENVEKGYFLLQQVGMINIENDKTASFTLCNYGEKAKYDPDAYSLIKGVSFGMIYNGQIPLTWNMSMEDQNKGYKHKVYLSKNDGTDWTYIGSSTGTAIDVINPYIENERYATVKYNAVKIVSILGGAQETFIDNEISLTLTPGRDVAYPAAVVFTKGTDDAGENYYGKFELFSNSYDSNLNYKVFLYDKSGMPVVAKDMNFFNNSTSTNVYFNGEDQIDAVENGYYEIAAISNISVDETRKTASCYIGKTYALAACTPSDDLDLKVEVMEGANNIHVSFNMPVEYDEIKIRVGDDVLNPEYEEMLAGNVIPDLAEYIYHVEYWDEYNIHLVGIKNGVYQEDIAVIPVKVTTGDTAYSYEMSFGADGKNHTATLQPMPGALKLLANWNNGKNEIIPAPTAEMQHVFHTETALTDDDYISIVALMAASVENGTVKFTMTPMAEKQYEVFGKAWLEAGPAHIQFKWEPHPNYTEYRIKNSADSNSHITESTLYSIFDYIINMTDKDVYSIDISVEGRYEDSIWAELENAVTITGGASENVDITVIGLEDGLYQFVTNVPENGGRMFVFEMVDPDGNFMAGYNGHYIDSSSTINGENYVLPNGIIRVAPYEGCTFNVYQYDWTVGDDLNTINVTRSYKSGISFTPYNGFAAETEVSNETELMEALNKGGIVRLKNDIELDVAYAHNITINRGQAVELDLNGKTLYLNKNSLYVTNGKQMVIKNGTISGYVAGEGEDVEGVDSSSKIEVSGGANLTLENGTFVGVYGGARYLIIRDAVVNGSVTETATQFIIEESTADSVHASDSKNGNGTTTINNCAIGYLDLLDTHDAGITDVTIDSVRINGGTAVFERVSYEGVGMDLYGDCVLTINSGNYTYTGKYDLFPTGFNTVIINGGTFNFDPTEYLADGKTATENGDGTWTVQ